MGLKSCITEGGVQYSLVRELQATIASKVYSKVFIYKDGALVTHSTQAVPGSWQANTLYSLNVKISASGRYYTTTTGGVSGSVEPTWPESGSVADGDCIWSISTFIEDPKEVNPINTAFSAYEYWHPRDYSLVALPDGAVALFMLFDPIQRGDWYNRGANASVWLTINDGQSFQIKISDLHESPDQEYLWGL